MKKGIVAFALYASTVIYIYFLAYLVTNGFDPDKPAFGQSAVDIYSDTLMSRKLYFYIDQSARNAVFLTLQDFRTRGFFDIDHCSTYEGRAVLFNKDSCTLTPENLANLFLDRFLMHYQTYFQQPVYGVAFPQSFSRDALHLRINPDSLLISGSFQNNPLSYAGKKVSYTLPHSFSETIKTSFADVLSLYATAERELACILLHKTQAASQCSLSSSGTWTFEQQGDYLFVTATSSRDLSFSFAINLNTASLTSSSLFS